MTSFVSPGFRLTLAEVSPVMLAPSLNGGRSPLEERPLHSDDILLVVVASILTCGWRDQTSCGRDSRVQSEDTFLHTMSIMVNITFPFKVNKINII